eukprot:CAMPEP_0201251312 /NCGR_PEP_ID=MMETSP0852-20130820/66282_1 /ASSEMBLY_ACC=CAM_ASM_000632 /TAXON_ID=183588 /ORGANISM="Pseudo-nitzschia fraudulenta, Strain WWA7" /LENGTH=171 /DNA_ID=CAMNT_0047550887 /DNA_START=38 /DNA_END=554 /DNA_ORIENTATION=+
MADRSHKLDYGQSHKRSVADSVLKRGGTPILFALLRLTAKNERRSIDRVFRIDSSNNTSIGSINSSSISISNGTEEFDQSTLIATALAAAKPTSRGVEEGCSNNSIGGNSGSETNDIVQFWISSMHHHLRQQDLRHAEDNGDDPGNSGSETAAARQQQRQSVDKMIPGAGL